MLLFPISKWEHKEDPFISQALEVQLAYFWSTCRSRHDQIGGDILEMLMSFTDFMTFKEMFLEYRSVSVLYVSFFTILSLHVILIVKGHFLQKNSFK